MNISNITTGSGMDLDTTGGGLDLDMTADISMEETQVVILGRLPDSVTNCVRYKFLENIQDLISLHLIRLFNIVSQYGQVRKIMFTKSGGLEVDQCRVVMTSSKGAAELQKNLFNQELFGEIIQASLGVLVEEDENPVMFELEDGSRSWKNFVMDGAPWPETCFPPSKVELYGY